MAQAPTNDDDELHPIHPKLRTLERYISRSWFDSVDRGIYLETATQTDLNDYIIYHLDWFLEDDISGRKLYRIVCGEFSQWNANVWKRVHPQVRKEFCKVLSERGVSLHNNDPSTEDSASKPPELLSADRTDVGPPLDKTSSDSNKKEEKSPEEPASVRSEGVHFEEKQASVPSQEKPTAALDDKACVSLSMGRCTNLRKNDNLDEERYEEKRLAEPPDRQKISADTRSTATPVSKDSAADKVSANPVQRRSKNLQRGCPTEAALDKDSVVDRALVVLPDPPDFQRRRSSEGERPAKSPGNKPSPEDTLPAYPAVCKDLVAGVALYDLPHGSKDHGDERTVKPPDKGRKVVDAVTNDSDSRMNRADHIFDEVSEVSFEEPLNNDFPVHSKASCDENHTTSRHRDPTRTPADPPDGTGPQKQKRKEEKILPGEFALASHCSLPSTGTTWTDRAERLTPPSLTMTLTRATWSPFPRHSWNNCRLVERLVP
ncbi:hypothetical protein E4U14_004643 [Claviceps sp. LM454 group G7]|nr:hypothetical protein E4U14_004643 [Claviceps sp. LM454 group G7]